MKIFVDTNVLISATLTRGLTADLFRLVLAEHELLVGQVVLEEFERILRDRFRVSPLDLAETLKDLRRFTVVPRPTAASPIRLRDEADGWVLASAEIANADLLITGDRDLLEVAAHSTIPIVTPRAAWERLRSPPP